MENKPNFASEFLPNQIIYNAASPKREAHDKEENQSYYQILRAATEMRDSLLNKGLLNVESVQSLCNMVESQKLAMDLHTNYSNYLTGINEFLDRLNRTINIVAEGGAAGGVDLSKYLAAQATRFHSDVSLHGGPKIMTASNNMLKAIQNGEGMRAAFEEVKSTFQELNRDLSQYFTLGVELGLPQSASNLDTRIDFQP